MTYAVLFPLDGLTANREEAERQLEQSGALAVTEDTYQLSTDIHCARLARTWSRLIADVVTTYRVCLTSLIDLPAKLAYNKLANHLLNRMQNMADRGELLEPEAADKVTIGLALRRYEEMKVIVDEGGQVRTDLDQINDLLRVLTDE